ncbi:glycosyltransferase family 4 protein [Luteolibacter sp. AS25]|uniref:glycosyltransferase family 4 protein n=1 Tax=Luteolibacter sp. AS25 TaxID=3135776 RepID=UPI00398A5568
MIDISETVAETKSLIAEKLQNGAPNLKFSLSNEPVSSILQIEETQLRVVIVHASPSWGTGYYLHDLALELLKLGHKVYILAEGTCAPFDRGVRWATISFDGLLLSKELRDEMKRFQPNLIFEAGVRTKPMRAALELCISYQAKLVVQAEDDEFIPFEQK